MKMAAMAVPVCDDGAMPLGGFAPYAIKGIVWMQCTPHQGFHHAAGPAERAPKAGTSAQD
jgi:hypothetical protein